MKVELRYLAGMLALTLGLLGAGLLVPTGEWAWRLALILGFFSATLPVASRRLAHAAVLKAGLDAQFRDARCVGDEPH